MKKRRWYPDQHRQNMTNTKCKASCVLLSAWMGSFEAQLNRRYVTVHKICQLRLSKFLVFAFHATAMWIPMQRASFCREQVLKEVDASLVTLVQLLSCLMTIQCPRVWGPKVIIVRVLSNCCMHALAFKTTANACDFVTGFVIVAHVLEWLHCWMAQSKACWGELELCSQRSQRPEP